MYVCTFILSGRDNLYITGIYKSPWLDVLMTDIYFISNTILEEENSTTPPLPSLQIHSVGNSIDGIDWGGSGN